MYLNTLINKDKPEYKLAVPAIGHNNGALYRQIQPVYMQKQWEELENQLEWPLEPHMIDTLQKNNLRGENIVKSKRLFICTDNTTKEAKNYYFLGFLQYLVDGGYIKDALYYNLALGHTHFDRTTSSAPEKPTIQTLTTAAIVALFDFFRSRCPCACDDQLTRASERRRPVYRLFE